LPGSKLGIVFGALCYFKILVIFEVIDRTYWYHEDTNDNSEEWEWEEIDDETEMPTDEELNGKKAQLLFIIEGLI